MAKVATIARRTFLVGSALIAGGVAFGIYEAKKAIPNPLLDDLDEGEAAITPFVKIDSNGVTLITPRADKGQGTYSIQAYLIAEELDINPLRCNLDPGEPHQAYYNGVATGDNAPFPAYDHGWIPDHLRDILSSVGKIMAFQITGGSTSVADMHERLLTAGAVARETLKEAASRRWKVNRSELKTENGAVIAPDGKKLAYTELATDAAKIDPVTDVALRAPQNWRYLGKPVQRTDIIAKSTGTQILGIDAKVDGMVHATVRANPGIGGDVKKFDASKAQKMRGVKKVLPIKHGIAIVADNTWRAIQAANAIEIEWGPGPYPATTDKMWEALQASATDEFLDKRWRDDGDVDKELASGKVITAEYRAPYLAHAPLEPMNAIVKVEDNRVDVWTGTQIPAFVRDHVASLTGVSAANVHVHVFAMGGSFGRRLEDTYVLQTTEIAMAMKGTPVKMTWSREEDMTHDYPRPMQLGLGRGTVKDGKVETYDLSSIGQSMTRSWFGRLMFAPPGPDMFLVAGAWDQPYGIPNYRVSGYAAKEMAPVSSWRAPGSCANGFLHEGFLDELIHAAGADPLEERLRLMIDPVSKKVLEAVGELSGWTGPKLGENRGRGVAFTHSHGVPCAEVIEVTNTPSGIKIDKVFVVTDSGKVLDPINYEAQAFGGVNFALAHAMNCELTYANYAPEQTNFDAYQGMRLYQSPQITVKALENSPNIRGIGEPTVPPAAPALANAIFAATGKRLREMPFNKFIDFV